MANWTVLLALKKSTEQVFWSINVTTTAVLLNKDE